jgi:glycosyltransferase involved in cell wall biosynthesis
VTVYLIAEWTVRKGIADAVRAFARAFGPDDGVRMVVKTTVVDRTTAARPRHPLDEGTSAYALGRLLAEVRHPPPVTLITRELDGGEVARLHAAGDCYLSLCRGEGWGIGAFDAATRGTPVITTGWGGHLDYLGGSSLLVRYELVDVDHGPGVDLDGGDQRWARPDVDHAVELLRAVVADPGGRRDERDQIARGIAETCSPRAVAARWLEAAGARAG